MALAILDCAFTLLMLALLFYVLIACQAGPVPEEVAAEILSDPAYQVELPIGREEQAPAASPSSSRPRRENERVVHLRPSEATGAIVKLFGWILLSAAVVAAGVWLARALMNLHRAPTLEPELAATPSGSPSPKLSARPLEDAEALAREGRFAEAIHALLLLSYEELQEHGGLQLKPALTSREILARLPIPEPCRPELRPLVSTVETSRFGTRQPGREEFDACAAHYRRFVEIWEESGE